jgi:hypothetical protein
MSYRGSDTKTTLSSDGLRYTAKKPGSVFPSAGVASSSRLMSCFHCGRHKHRSELTTKKILGRHEKVCLVNCRAGS